MPNEPEETKRCDVDGCGAEAVYTYAWDWGQTGVCCAQHLTLLQQKASQINRTLMFTQIVPSTPAPLTRDERCTLKARANVLEEELAETKQRGLELYRKNGELTQQVQTLVLREREAKAQITDGLRAVAVLEERLEQRDRECAQLVDEVERLRTLAAFVEGVAAASIPAPPPQLELNEPT